MKIADSQELPPHPTFQKGVDISDFLSMRIGGPVGYFCIAMQEDDVRAFCHYAKSRDLPVLVMGGGSNLLVARKGFEGLLIKMEIMGIVERFRDAHEVVLDVAAGEDWDGFVSHTIKNGYWGCENMSLIPGTVGATPVQNVGAFGQEVKNIIRAVNCYDKKRGGFNSEVHNSTEIGKAASYL